MKAPKRKKKVSKRHTSVVEASAFCLRHKGHTAGILKVNSEAGLPELTLFDKQGERIKLCLTSDGAARFILRSGDGKRVVGIAIDADGPGIQMVDSAKVSVSISIQEPTGNVVRVFDSTGTVSVFVNDDNIVSGQDK